MTQRSGVLESPSKLTVSELILNNAMLRAPHLYCATLTVPAAYRKSIVLCDNPCLKRDRTFMSLSAYEKLHMVHRCWRLRFKSEVPSIQYVRQADLAGRTVLDIGANKGVYSIYMSRAVGPSGKLVAFEAQPELGDHLRAVKHSFRLDNMSLVNQGLSSIAGVLTMRRTAAGSGMASFHNDAAEGLDEIDIPVIALDKYIEEHDLGPVDFIKCDVEGHELEVFRGAERMLLRDKPALLFECHDAEAENGELFRFLTGLGYDGYFFYVTPADHKSLFNKGRGQFIPYDQQASYKHVHPSVRHRNYVFVEKGTQP
jgi:FkbM family methyltransferase